MLRYWRWRSSGSPIVPSRRNWMITEGRWRPRSQGIQKRCRLMFKADKFVDEQVKAVSDAIKGKAIIACSGGVDSMVAATIASKAIGDRLLAVYVDTGLMRKGETDEVRKMLDDMGVNFKIIDASKEYFEALKGVTDPETKRKIIGEKF